MMCALVVNTTLYPPVFVDLGEPWEQVVSRSTQWFTFILSVLMSFWFVYNMFTGHCGWEVIFVTVIECKFPSRPADVALENTLCINTCAPIPRSEQGN